VVKRSFLILPVIIVSQFAGTSLWFASNAVLGDLQQLWSLGNQAIGYMTSAVQLGFIVGTLCFTFFAVSDRFSPRMIFFICSLLGAASNLSIYFLAQGLVSLLVLRFLTGFFLAGIYPVGMKIASGWYKEGLGKALGFLVGAVVVGTAFPHLLKSYGQSVAWETVILSVSGISFAGGILMLLFVPDGPYLFKGTRFDRKVLAVIFRSRNLRSAALGYFGHMWELYALWAFVPVVIINYTAQKTAVDINVSFWAFCTIAAGGLGCAGGGMISRKAGSASIALIQLIASGICCLLSPLFYSAPVTIFLGCLLFWGIVVAGDSPQFSALVAQTAPKEFVGSALTIVNCIGFSITIVSIQLLTFISDHISLKYIFLFLIVGPLFGVFSLWPLLRPDQRS